MFLALGNRLLAGGGASYFDLVNCSASSNPAGLARAFGGSLRADVPRKCANASESPCAMQGPGRIIQSLCRC